MAANRRPHRCRIWRAGTGQQRRWPHWRYDAAEWALQALLEFHGRTWLRQAEGVLGGVRHADADAHADGHAEHDADGHADRDPEHDADRDPEHDADRVAEPEPDVYHPARSGADAGDGHPSSDGLRRWEPMGGG